MLSLSIFLPTLYNVPHFFYLFAIIIIIMRDRRIFISLDKKQLQSLYIICVIMFFSLINYLFGLEKVDSVGNILPYFIVYMMTFYISSKLTHYDLKILIWLIFIEILFIFFEFSIGANTIFTSNPDYRDGLSYEYLYFFRPHGLSSESSTMAYKVMVFLLLIDFLNIKSKIYKLLKYIGLIAMILTFNRTVIIAMMLYYAIKNYKDIFKLKYFLLVILIVVPIIIYNFDLITNTILNQFNRGRSDLDLSYRDVIWQNNFNFIKEHILFGNNSFKFFTILDEYGEYEHAHNSYIQTLSTNGIIIFILYMILIFVNIRKENFVFIFPILVYSMYQYGIFWAISIVDIIFLYFLVFYKKIYKINNSMLNLK